MSVLGAYWEQANFGENAIFGRKSMKWEKDDWWEKQHVQGKVACKGGNHARYTCKKT
jgi:hypothetical protein